MSDPTICEHARRRCEQMGISTKVAKRIYRNPTLTLPDFSGHPDRRFLHSTSEPDYAIVVESRLEGDWVVTVLNYDVERYRERPFS